MLTTAKILNHTPLSKAEDPSDGGLGSFNTSGDASRESAPIGTYDRRARASTILNANKEIITSLKKTYFGSKTGNTLPDEFAVRFYHQQEIPKHKVNEQGKLIDEDELELTRSAERQEIYRNARFLNGDDFNLEVISFYYTLVTCLTKKGEIPLVARLGSIEPKDHGLNDLIMPFTNFEIRQKRERERYNKKATKLHGRVQFEANRILRANYVSRKPRPLGQSTCYCFPAEDLRPEEHILKKLVATHQSISPSDIEELYLDVREVPLYDLDTARTEKLSSIVRNMSTRGRSLTDVVLLGLRTTRRGEVTPILMIGKARIEKDTDKPLEICKEDPNVQEILGKRTINEAVELEDAIRGLYYCREL